ncbi:hypothetical protein TRVA0_035S01420 [Trichomonascus vanleenenianus]|uniref:glucose-induced degradation complex subunit GID8 n=1 Tax=Trichomonascus vanleenenianus TaxID=2268995 RepID=UPI003EC99EBE
MSSSSSPSNKTSAQLFHSDLGLRKYTREQWDARLAETAFSRATLDKLIMNHLIANGYESTARRFKQEANLKTDADLDTLSVRRQIMTHIRNGDIEEAIVAINDMDPELLDTNSSLHFALLRLQLIELIKRGSQDGNIKPALEFASNNLSQRAPKNPEFLADLEKAMALLCFPHEHLVPQLQELMDPKLRRVIAEQVNQALMERQQINVELQIGNLVRLWGWGEDSLTEYCSFPPLRREDLFYKTK